MFHFAVMTYVSPLAAGHTATALVLAIVVAATGALPAAERPNIVLIYADDLGPGDLRCLNPTAPPTPSVDAVARQGITFTAGYAAAATCTPSRYSLLTGEYAFRKQGTGILPGDARLIIEPGRVTLPAMLQGAGYRTGVVGKWHLGLGGAGGPDWNGEIGPGPLDVGFDECFLIPATADRVPTVYVEGRRVVGLDPADPLAVDFGTKIGTEPTGRENPELLTVRPSHGHDMTIVNGVSRIGYQSGGKAAWWSDEEMADVLTARAVRFLETNKGGPFFLYFATHDIHVPRLPHDRFAGTSGMGPRGDAIVQFDACVGAIAATLDRLGLAENTLLLITGDNGPVVDDGYQDDAAAKLGDHRPAGPLRGGKYSAFEGGTRVPWIARWPAGGVVGGRASAALVSQVDLLRSFAALTGQTLPEAAAPDSRDVLPALLGRSETGRPHVVEQAGTIALRRGDWKLIPPGRGPAVNKNTNTELGNAPTARLYDLAADPGERTDVAAEHPGIVAELTARLEAIEAGRDAGP